MSLPTLIVTLDTGDLLTGAQLDNASSAQLDTAVLATGTPRWDKNITPYVRGFNINRGAARELDRTEAGTGFLLLDNRDGRFTPFNASSPYFPNIKPMRRIRIQATWSPVTYPVFVAYVEAWPVSFPGDVDRIVQVQLVDGFKRLSRAIVSGNFPQQTSGQRVQAILDAIDWLETTDIETGSATVPAITLTNAGVLEYIHQVTYAEGGRFYFSRDGTATFRDRNPPSAPDFSTRTWADDGTGMSYRDIVPDYSDTLIANDVHITRTGGTEQVASDKASQVTYGLRTLIVTDVQLSSDAQAVDLADLLLARYAEPKLRLDGLTDNAMQHDFWDRVLARELTDQVNVIESQTATAQISLIEGIAHDVGTNTWTVTLRLSPSEINVAGILDDATFGLLDSTAILGR